MKKGSPPLARERPPVSFLPPGNLGITPAGAGTTEPVCLPIGLSWDHPRWRGNDGIKPAQPGVNGGSPPLARERHLRLGQHVAADRITPAGAGTTHSVNPRPIQQAQTDHPRWRGNDERLGKSRQRLKGSPPLARERQLPLTGENQQLRITPAGAGTTLRSKLADSQIRDHPRWRGNDPILPVNQYAWLGSPPLARERLSCS